MNWHDLSANWTALQDSFRQRFPNLDMSLFRSPPRDRAALTRELAAAHELTLLEAHQELEEFMTAEDLARQAMDVRAIAPREMRTG